MEASLRLPHKGLSQREHQRIQLYELPRLPQNQKFSRGNEDSCCHFCAIDVAHGIIVENRHMKHCHHFYLLPQKGNSTQSFSKGSRMRYLLLTRGPGGPVSPLCPLKPYTRE